MGQANKTKVRGITGTAALLRRHLPETGKAVSLDRAVEKSLGTLFGRALIGLYIVQDGKFQYVNPGLLDSMGYSERELLGVDSLSFVHPEDRRMVRDNAVKMLKGESPAPYEYRIISKGGETRWVVESVTPVEYQGRQATLGYFMDVTERKQAEEELQESEEFNSSLLQNSPTPILVINPDTSIKYVNPALEELTGFTLAELIDQKAPYPWWATENLEEGVAVLREVLRERVTGVERLQRKKNGEQFWVEVGTVPVISNGELKYCLSSWVDITERKRAEEELNLRAELLNSASDSINLADFDGNLIYVNEIFCRSHGYSREELIGMNLRQLDLPEYGKLLGSRYQKLRKEGQLTFETAQLRKGGSPMNVEVHARVIKSGNSELVLSVDRDITKRKRAEEELQEKNEELDAQNEELQVQSEELREAEEFQSSLLDNSPTPISVLNPDTSIKYVNPAMERLTGFTSDEMVGKRAPHPWWLEDEASVNMRELQEDLRKGVRGMEKLFQRRDGAQFWVEVTSTQIARNGEFQYCLITWVDITERKKAEEALQEKNEELDAQNEELQVQSEELQESEEFNSSLLDNAPNPIAVLNPDTSIRYVNPALEELTGFTSAELLGMKAPYPWWTTETASEISKFKENIRKRVRWYEWLFQKKSGERFWVGISDAPIRRNGELQYTLTNWVDITERKKAEEELQEKNEELDAQNEELQVQSEELQEKNEELDAQNEELQVQSEALREAEEFQSSLLDNSPTPMSVVNPDTSMRYINPAMEKLTGFTSAEIVGKRAPHSWWTEDEQSGSIDEIGENISQGVNGLEKLFQKKNGERFWVEITAVPVMRNGEFQYGLTSWVDITERKKAEEALQELDRMKSEFISNVSHELRTPLHSIGGFAKLLLEDKVPDADTQQEFLGIIDKQSEHLGGLIDSLLDISRLESGQFQIQKRLQPIRSLILEAIDGIYSLATEKEIAITQDIPETLPELKVDGGRLRQVIVNLLSNAIKFSDPGGSVTVRSEVQKRKLLVQVIDRGAGIPEAAIPHLFSRFYRAGSSAAVGGAGLGLYISKQIVETHGGRIWVESKVGEGSTFSFTLPLSKSGGSAHG